MAFEQSQRLDGVLVTQYGADMTVEILPDKSAVTRRADGLTIIRKADGLTMVTASDGFIVTVYADGHKIAKHENDTVVETHVDGSRTIFPTTGAVIKKPIPSAAELEAEAQTTADQNAAYLKWSEKYSADDSDTGRAAAFAATWRYVDDFTKAVEQPKIALNFVARRVTMAGPKEGRPSQFHVVAYDDNDDDLEDDDEELDDDDDEDPEQSQEAAGFLEVPSIVRNPSMKSRRTMRNPSEDAQAAVPSAASTAAGPTGAIVRQGWLLKEGGTYKSWKKRYFLLNDFGRLVYHDKPDGKFINAVYLQGCQIHEHPDPKKPFLFSVVTQVTSNNKRTRYLFRAADSADLRDWIASIQQVSVRDTRADRQSKVFADSTIDSRKAPDRPRVGTLQEPQGGSPTVTAANSAASFSLVNKVRHMVSKEKVRFRDDGFDLDLTYITDRLIAMGFPSDGTESLYRNKMVDVQRFFETKHQGRYKVYNLCSERSYPPRHFVSRVAVYPFEDHHPPPVHLMADFCHDASKWLVSHPENVIAVHCKAGKGRTGLMMSCLLLHTGTCASAADALQLFGDIRTGDGEGVTLPSQRRYVGYYERIARQGLPPRASRQLIRVVLETTPNFDIMGGCNPYFNLYHNFELICTSKPTDGSRIPSVKNIPELMFEVGVEIDGDVKIEFVDEDALGADTMFYFCFHPSFVDGNVLRLERTEIDGAHKKKHLKTFSEQFAVRVHFE
eukprot:m.120576 g.120576  ORF g.120576 m.120576 type:complete len:726 (-) comp52085_c0_seq1:1050-3227(-)